MVNVRSNFSRLFILALACLTMSCGSECLALPCPVFEAVTITVSGSGAAGRPAGLAIAVGNQPAQASPCDEQSVCHVLGGPGAYSVVITADGYRPLPLDVVVTGETAGCNTCGRVDRRQVSVVLQRAP